MDACLSHRNRKEQEGSNPFGTANANEQGQARSVKPLLGGSKPPGGTYNEWVSSFNCAEHRPVKSRDIGSTPI